VRDTAVAARYAHALFLVTEKRGETDRALEDMRAIGVAAASGSKVAQMLAGPLVLLSDKRAAVRNALKGRALPVVAVFMDLLLRKHRITDLPVIVDQFQALVERKHGVQRAAVTSAVPLTEAELMRLHRELETLTGGKIVLATAVDLTLVGGAQVRIGDRLIDRSVRTMLEGLEQRLIHSIV
jgi:F-type H+-transporting ATPase subunit delta